MTIAVCKPIVGHHVVGVVADIDAAAVVVHTVSAMKGRVDASDGDGDESLARCHTCSLKSEIGEEKPTDIASLTFPPLEGTLCSVFSNLPTADLLGLRW